MLCLSWYVWTIALAALIGTVGALVYVLWRLTTQWLVDRQP